MVALLALLLLQDPDETRRAETDAHCLECHEDQAATLAASVHRATGCVECHGWDEIRVNVNRGNPHRKLASFKSARGRNLTEDCGACHTAVLESLRGSKHYVDTRRPVGSMKKGCIDCHDYHEVQPAVRGVVFNTCKLCHDPSSKEHEAGRRLVQDLDLLEARSAQVELRMKPFEGRAGISTRGAAEAVRFARRQSAELAVAQHGMKFEELAMVQGRAAQRLEEAERDLTVRQVEALESRWAYLSLFLLFAASGAVFVVLKAKQARRGTP